MSTDHDEIPALGEFIKSKRVEMGITQAALGNLCEVSQTTIGVWEKGQNSPSVANLRVLAGLFGVPATTLYDLKNKSRTLKTYFTPEIGFGTKAEALTEAGEEIEDQDIPWDVANPQEAIVRRILEGVCDAIPAAEVGKSIRNPFGITWRLDVSTKEIVVEIITSDSLSAARRAVLSLAALRAFSRDDPRAYHLIILMPFEEDDSVPDWARAAQQETKVRRQVDAQAALLGVTVERVYDSRNAIDTIVAAHKWQEPPQKVDD